MPKNTLTQQKDIKVLLAGGNRYTHKNIATFYWQENPEGRIAIACPKRVLKLAVERNSFKRKNRALAQGDRSYTSQLDLFVLAQPGLSRIAKENRSLVIRRAWSSFLNQLNSV
ncbi:MAG: ribonuclease P protein component [Pseudomonadota bacterium]|nr:ribonuclease P protein component [Pseudomonadota bacterium]